MTEQQDAILPPGDRMDVITYAIRDRQGMKRGSGIRDLEAARRSAGEMAENATIPTSFIIERVSYVSFTHREDIETVSSGGPS